MLSSPDKQPCCLHTPRAGDSGGPLMMNVGSPASPMDGSAADDRLVGAVSWWVWRC